MIKHGSLEIVFLTRAHSRHLCDVFGRLVHHDVHRVVNSDNSHHQSVLIQDRQGEKIIFGEELRDLFLVCVSAHGDDLSLHQVFDQHIII